MGGIGRRLGDDAGGLLQHRLQHLVDDVVDGDALGLGVEGRHDAMA